MQGLGGFFKRIQSSIGREIAIRDCVVKAVKLHTGADISIGSLKIKGGSVELVGIDQAFKSAVFVKKQAILKSVNENQQIRKIADIR